MARSKTTNKRTASRKKATPRKKSSAKASASRVSSQRKKEILGVILMALAVLLSLALITYNAADDALARRFSFSALFDPGGSRAANALGLVGAVLAWMLVPNFLGYTTLMLTVLLLVWGYFITRHK